jgi:hypothetical protein
MGSGIGPVSGYDYDRLGGSAPSGKFLEWADDEQEEDDAEGQDEGDGGPSAGRT